MNFMLGSYILSRNSEDGGDLLILRNSLEIDEMGIRITIDLKESAGEEADESGADGH